MPQFRRNRKTHVVFPIPDSTTRISADTRGRAVTTEEDLTPEPSTLSSVPEQSVSDRIYGSVPSDSDALFPSDESDSNGDSGSLIDDEGEGFGLADVDRKKAIRKSKVGSDDEEEGFFD